MQSRIENIKEVSKILLDIGLSNEDIASLFNLFDELEQKFVIGKARFSDVELLVQSIHDFTINLSDEHCDLLNKQINKLSKSYINLFPLFLGVFQEARADQAKYAANAKVKDQVENSKKYTSYLKQIFIKSMLFELARTSNNFYISKFIGTIPIVGITNHDIPIAKREYSNADTFLKENLELLKLAGQVSALKPYLMALYYLNNKNTIATTVQSNKTFIDYLKSVKNISHDADGISLSLIMVSSEILSLCLSDPSDKSHLSGATMASDQTILISMHDGIQIAKTLIHETQHFYNAIFFKEFNQLIYPMIISINLHYLPIV